MRQGRNISTVHDLTKTDDAWCVCISSIPMDRDYCEKSGEEIVTGELLNNHLLVRNKRRANQSMVVRWSSLIFLDQKYIFTC